ncbi:MAG: transglutaminase domain-containing protein [Tissierellia bacterium]|nr:transglutaminase domain-containing protein [Tissierellia bacterium]
MNWFQKVWNRIVSSNDEPYILKIKELKSQISDYQKDIGLLETQLEDEVENYYEMKKQYESMQKTKNELLEELETYKKVEVPFTIPTDIIDVGTFGYLPNTVYFYWDGTKPASKTVPVQVHKFYRNFDDNMFQFFREKVKGKTTYKDKFIALRNACYDVIKYKHDLGVGLKQGENWKMPSEIFYSGIDDCDGFTTLFVTACNICNIPADRVFNATGHYKHPNGWIGHSFPVVKFDDNQWYVLEGTSKIAPILFKTSTVYKITKDNMLNGLSNWEMSGKAKKEQF